MRNKACYSGYTSIEFIDLSGDEKATANLLRVAYNSFNAEAGKEQNSGVQFMDGFISNIRGVFKLIKHIPVAKLGAVAAFAIGVFALIGLITSDFGFSKPGAILFTLLGLLSSGVIWNADRALKEKV